MSRVNKDRLSIEQVTRLGNTWKEVASLSGKITKHSINIQLYFTNIFRNVVVINLSPVQLGALNHLVRSFLNIRVPSSTQGLDDGLVEGGEEILKGNSKELDSIMHVICFNTTSRTLTAIAREP